MRANEGLIFDVGVEVSLKMSSGVELATQLMADWKYSVAQGDNGSLTYTAIPLTAIEQLTLHNGISLGRNRGGRRLSDKAQLAWLRRYFQYSAGYEKYIRSNSSGRL